MRDDCVDVVGGASGALYASGLVIGVDGPGDEEVDGVYDVGPLGKGFEAGGAEEECASAQYRLKVDFQQGVFGGGYVVFERGHGGVGYEEYGG